MLEYFIREALMHLGREGAKAVAERVMEKRNEQKQAERRSEIATCTECGQPLCKNCSACHNSYCWAATL